MSSDLGKSSTPTGLSVFSSQTAIPRGVLSSPLNTGAVREPVLAKDISTIWAQAEEAQGRQLFLACCGGKSWTA